jgi:hypothetical protein
MAAIWPQPKIPWSKTGVCCGDGPTNDWCTQTASWFIGRKRRARSTPSTSGSDAMRESVAGSSSAATVVTTRQAPSLPDGVATTFPAPRRATTRDCDSPAARTTRMGAAAARVPAIAVSSGSILRCAGGTPNQATKGRRLSTGSMAGGTRSRYPFVGM